MPPKHKESFMKKFIKDLCIDGVPSDTIIIGDDFALVTYNREDNPCSPIEPYKLTHAIIAIGATGQCTFRLNLQEYNVDSPTILTLMPGQIIEDIKYSSDFEGYAIVLSKRFIDILNLPGWQQQYMSLYHNPINPIDAEFVELVKFFYAILCKAASNQENPFRLQVIENLIRVFYYGGISKLQPANSEKTSYKNNIVERFIELVQEHYREERLIGFYADKLCITPKYLSKLVKENTGRSAGEWIERHVILEARAMLKSSDYTIQQIATSLNFPNQSFFGKYFKRATGLSPKQYRNSK
jgi:AraC-like DNA-binding protein